MKKKILVLANLDIGLYKFRKDLLKAILDMGYEVYISLPNGELISELEKIGCCFIETPLDRRGMNPVKDLGLLLKYRKILKQVKPDRVITYTIKPNIYGSIACRSRGISYAINITGLGTAFQEAGFTKKLVTCLYRIACKQASTVFFENQGNKAVFVKEKILSEEKGYCLSGAGVNLQEYPFTPYPMEGKSVKFLFIGRVMKEKGVDELFYAIERLNEEEQKVQLDVVGLFEEDYRQVIDGFTQRGIIRFHGYQEDVKPFIEKCHCLVLPSYHEGMSNTLLEAGAMGRPLITSDIYGCREAVSREKEINGLLAEAKNKTELYEKMKIFIKMPYYEKKKMGEVSRKWIEQKFDKKKVIKETITRLEM